MIEVTVLFLDETFSSTAIGPMEVFRQRERCGIISLEYVRFLAFE